MTTPDRLRYLKVAWAFVETLIFGGLIYGWTSLVFILKDKFIYWELCDQVNDHLDPYGYNVTQADTDTSSPVHVYGTSSPLSNFTLVTSVDNIAPHPGGQGAAVFSCKTQDNMLNLVFTVGSSLFCAGCAVMGHVSYKFGTRVTRIISMIVFVSGALMIAFVSREVPWLLFPGLTCIGIGGIPLLVTNTQLSNLFSKGSSTIVGLMCGAFDMSAGVQLLIKLAYEGGFRLQHSYFVLIGLHSMVIVSTFFFLPKGFIPRPQPPEVEQEVTYRLDNGDTPSVELLDKEKQMEEVKIKPDDTRSPLTNEKQVRSLKSCIFSSAFLLHVLWLSILQLRFYYYLSTLNPILYRVTHNDKKLVSYFTDVSMYMMMAAIVTSPFAGLVYDWQKGFFINSASQLRRELMPSVIPLMIGTILGLVLTVLCLIPTLWVLYIIFITVTFFRSFLYCMGAAFFSAVFPSEYFGLLYGLMIVCAGVVSFLQYGLFRWADAADFTQVNYFFLFLVSITFVHPIWQWIKCRRAESLAISS